MQDNNVIGQGQINTSLPMPEEKNEYALLQFKRDFIDENDKEGTQKFQKIVFYKMNPDGTYENGTTLEEMLRVSIERLNNLNSRFYCIENSHAIIKMEEALMWLNKRTEDRKKEVLRVNILGSIK